MIRHLLNMYPDLKYDPISRSAPGTAESNTGYVYKFIDHQKKLMKKGYDKYAAFDITEKLF